MAGGSAAKDHPLEYLLASAGAAAINYPLWRASAVGQSGFRVTSSISIAGLGSIPPSMSPYIYAFAPPYKGMLATVLGMTWARAAIFWGSDRGRELLKSRNAPEVLATVVPPLMVSTMVQCINMPVVRASITLQNPNSDLPHTYAALQRIYSQHGIKGLWHGTSAGILKTVPKYCTAVIVKDYMESILPQPDESSATLEQDRLWRSATKSAAAGVAGAGLTNPLDVIRNEMFKTNQSLTQTCKSLYEELGYSFLWRGMGKNMVAVAIPVGCTIFFTDALIQMSNDRMRRNECEN
jgi:Mitochondrial carrier protein